MGTDSESIFGQMHRDELTAGKQCCAACTRKLVHKLPLARGETPAIRAARAIAVGRDAAGLTFRSYAHGDWPGRVIWGGPERWPVCPIR